MELTINTSQTFDNLLSANKRVTHHIGGTRSGKTYSILQYLVVNQLDYHTILRVEMVKSLTFETTQRMVDTPIAIELMRRQLLFL